MLGLLLIIPIIGALALSPIGTDSPHSVRHMNTHKTSRIKIDKHAKFLGYYQENLINDVSRKSQNLFRRILYLCEELNKIEQIVFVRALLTQLPFIISLPFQIFAVSSMDVFKEKLFTGDKSDITFIGNIPFSLMNELSIAIIRLLINPNTVWFEYVDDTNDIIESYYELHVSRIFYYTVLRFINYKVMKTFDFDMTKENSVWMLKQIYFYLRDENLLRYWFKTPEILVEIVNNYKSFLQEKNKISIPFFDPSFYVFAIVFETAKMHKDYYVIKHQKIKESYKDPIYLSCILDTIILKVLEFLFLIYTTRLDPKKERMINYKVFNICSHPCTGTIILEIKNKKDIAKLFRAIRKDPIYKILFPKNQYIIIIFH